MRPIIACFKLFAFVTWSLIMIPLMGLWRFFFGRFKIFYIMPRLYSNISCLIFNIKVKVHGDCLRDGHVIFVGNHLSYIDICVIGANLQATFISKAEVRGWPIFGILGALAKTVYIERSPTALPEAINSIKKSLESGRSLILFPEATSTNGRSVIPFKSSLFEIFLNPEIKDKLVVQPFTLSIDPPQNHDLYAWYGDMEMPPHLWQLANSKGVNLTLAFHQPRAAKNYDDRKEFAKDCHKDVLKGLDFKTKAP